MTSPSAQFSITAIRSARDPFVPQPSSHVCAEHDVRSTLLQRSVAQPFQHGRDKAHTGNASREVATSGNRSWTQLTRTPFLIFAAHAAQTDIIGGSVLATTTSPGWIERTNRRVAPKIECQIVEHPAPQTRAPEPRSPHAMYLHAADHFLGEQRRLRICIQLPAGDHMNVLAPRGEIEGEIAEELTRRRVVGEKVSVDEDGLSHACRDDTRSRLVPFQVGNPVPAVSSSPHFHARSCIRSRIAARST